MRPGLCNLCPINLKTAGSGAFRAHLLRIVNEVLPPQACGLLPEGAAQMVVGEATICLPLKGLVDL